MSDDEDFHAWLRSVLLPQPPIPFVDFDEVDAEGNVVRSWRLTNVTVHMTVEPETEEDK